MKHLTITRIAFVLMVIVAAVIYTDPCNRKPEPSPKITG